MELKRPQIVVMTPVRNEAWILPRFLEVTARIADRIIILDQNSTDGSAELCRKHPKVVFLENPSSDYDEAGRQTILIEAARQAVPQPRLLLALDADEIISADAMESEDWQRALSAAPGTVLVIEKPTFYGSLDRVIRYPGGFPLGFVDDNSPHTARFIHSVRVPMPPNAVELRLDGVKALHYALLRTSAQEAKARMYSALENVKGTRHLLARRQVYRAGRDYSVEGPMEPTPGRWIEGWEKLGIDMRSVPDDPPHWQDFEVLRLMAQHGSRRFWLDDIWTVNWEAMRGEAVRRGLAQISSAKIFAPPAALGALMKVPDSIYSGFLALRLALKRTRTSPNSPSGRGPALRSDEEARGTTHAVAARGV
jgi:hypothetical protein